LKWCRWLDDLLRRLCTEIDLIGNQNELGIERVQAYTR